MLNSLPRSDSPRFDAFFCRDTIDPHSTEKHSHYSQARRFSQTNQQDASDALKYIPEGYSYLAMALIGKDMLLRSKNDDIATMMTGITLAFRSLTPIEMDEVGTSYRKPLNWSMYNMRNKLLCEFFHLNGIWALVNNNISIDKQLDKIDEIKKAMEFRVNDHIQRHLFAQNQKLYFARSSALYFIDKQVLLSFDKHWPFCR